MLAFRLACRLRRSVARRRRRLPVMAALLAGIGVIPEFRQLLVESRDCCLALLQEISDERLLAVIQRLFFGQKLFDIVGLFVIRHSERFILPDFERVAAGLQGRVPNTAEARNLAP